MAPHGRAGHDGGREMILRRLAVIVGNTVRHAAKAATTMVPRLRLTLFPSEESKEGKWSVIFSLLARLIETSRDFREPLERSFDV
jgi:hypothetical protein